MRSESELFREFQRHLFGLMGLTPGETEFRLAEYHARFREAPDKPLSEEEFAAKLEQMKKEAPAYLAWLRESGTDPFAG